MERRFQKFPGAERLIKCPASLKQGEETRRIIAQFISEESVPVIVFERIHILLYGQHQRCLLGHEGASNIS